ncbi:hypothetical protein B0H19DRAFT_1146823 [Mycena capillaripes]|nr:hypothetical protein B0H19DRAFT_1146823 [Mycena capillaripes]
MSTLHYRKFLKRLQSQLQTEDYKAPEFVTLLSDLASTTQDVYLDFEGLSTRLGNSAGSRGPYCTLEELYDAYINLFESAMSTSSACRRYLAACNRAFDPEVPIFAAQDHDPATTLDNFYEQCEQLRASIVTATTCWDKTGPKVQTALGVYLRRRSSEWILWAESIMFPWFPDSRCTALRTDIPRLVERAQGHLVTFRDHHESLQLIMKEIESARVGAHIPPHVRPIIRTKRLVTYLLSLFMGYIFDVDSAAGRNPDHQKIATYLY